MLEQILRDMFIDPELLEELDDEQKQILFCKMREEQVRRWTEREKEDAVSENKPKTRNKKGCNVGWLLGEDNSPWTWVMGEHKNDQTIEQILEAESQRKAELLAQQEAEKLEREAEETLRKLKEEEDRLEAERRQKEEELRKKEEEAALYQSLKEAKAAQKKIDEEKKKEELQRKKLQEIRRNSNRMRRQSSQEIEGLKVKRSSEIYIGFKDLRKKFEKEAEHQSEEINREWKKQEEKAKRIEMQRREVARKARAEYDEYRRSMVVTSQVFGKALSALKRIREQRDSIKKPAVPDRSSDVSVVPKVGRPSCREAIVDWFKKNEKPKQVGFDSKSKKYYPWFHGMITRANAEELLEEKKVGTFLIRVSERIFGYAISYRDEERCKHYLINALDNKYQFFGSNQIVHESLHDLVHHHKNHSVNAAGDEKLKYACGQVREPPDYQELLVDSVLETTKL